MKSFKDRIKEIRRTLALLLQPGWFAELRVPRSEAGPQAGLFDDMDEMARTAADASLGPGIYITMNQISKSLRLKVTNEVARSTSMVRDGDIERLRWLLADFDPVRPSNTPSTTDEHEQALALAKEYRAYLADLGWPESVLADSGNGAHVLSRIDLPNDPQSCDLLKNCLEVLSLKFSTSAIQLDTGNFNPSRVTRAYGTKNRKGMEDGDRKHRWSGLLDVPSTIETVPVGKLNELASRVPSVPVGSQTKGAEFTVPRWLEKNGVEVASDAPWGKGGHKWILSRCPFDEEHVSKSAYIVQFADGGIAAGCLHNSCSGKTWPTLLSIYEALPDDGSDAQSGRISNQTSQLIQIVSPDLRLFRSPGGEGHATVSVKDHIENHAINSKVFKQWVHHRYFLKTGSAPRPQSVQQAVSHFESVAQFDSSTEPVCVRVASAGGMNYLDLADLGRQVIEFDTNGWRVVKKPGVQFRRLPGMLPLPVPQSGDINELRNFLNLQTDEDWVLFVVDLIAALFSSGPFPILGLHGEAGSAKTTTARIFREMIDPNASASRAMPKTVHDLMIMAKNGWVLCFDNLSFLSPSFSDCLCQLSTGGGFSTWELYTNTDEVLFDGQRPILVNGIEEVGTRTDLLDRTILLELRVIRKFRAEGEFWKNFKDVHPRLVGALLDIAVIALRELPKVEAPAQFRMADFAKLGIAAEAALGLERGAFIRAYKNNRQKANAVALEASPIANLICDLAKRPWQGTATGLMQELESRATGEVLRRRGWPKNPRVLAGMVRRLSTALRTAGIDVIFDRDDTRNRNRIISIAQMNPKPKTQGINDGRK